LHNNTAWHARKLPLIDFSDPKKVVKKTQVADSKYHLNILALGGSVTWGAHLHQRNESYPYVIQKLYEQVLGNDVDVTVDNMAIRATGSDYPSLCLQSMIDEANPNEPEKSYDLILLEFVLNGTDGFPQLLKRLRLRYPDAVIVFIELWSLMTMIHEEGTRKRVHHLGKDPNVKWTWRSRNADRESGKECGREVCSLSGIKTLVANVGGYVYELVRPENPAFAIENKWFSDRDWHHLSAVGHEVLAKDLLHALEGKQNNDMFKKEKRVGTWGMGDQCYNWFLSGKVAIDYEGAVMQNLLANTFFSNMTAKWTMQFDPISGGWIEFESQYSIPVPVGLGYMSRKEPDNYPVVKVSMNGKDPVVVDPKINKVSWVFPEAHVTVFAQLGLASPGRNRITIRPTELKSDPFRVVGVYLCGLCAETGNLGSGAIKMNTQTRDTNQ